ncbi:hypothetical protein LIA77_01978 [Sarocladium implicatum]|nr:hypothetical protein LIA77_01978 [Sarocladium implicatum]
MDLLLQLRAAKDEGDEADSSSTTTGFPTFTPASHCLKTSTSASPYIDGTRVDYIHLGVNKSSSDCIPEGASYWPTPFYPATQCPHSYEAVSTDSYTNEWDNTTTVRYQLYCCPTGHGFNYSASSAGYGDAQPTFQDLCAGSTTFRSTETSNPFLSPGADMQTSVVTVTRALVALAATVMYEVEGGTTTCAPNCDDPWRQGDPWPTTPPKPPEERSLQGLGELAIGLICGAIDDATWRATTDNA